MRLTILTLIITVFESFSIAQNKNCDILEYNTQVIFNGNKIEKTISYSILINNGAGTKYAEIYLPYTENNKIKNLEANISDLFGNKLRTLKKKDIEINTPYHNFEFHTDERFLSFKLIHNRFPYIVNYSYSITTNNYISLHRWNPAFKDELNVKKASFILEVPEKTSLQVYQHGVDSAQITTLPGVTRYTWKIENYICPEKQPFSPPQEEMLPSVVVMPLEFKYGIKGKSATWKEFGNWEYDLIKGRDILSEEEKIKVHSITDTIKNNTDKIKALYHYLQDNTRYIYIGLDIGGHQPYPASYVCTNRYGDCKALSNYMKAMLKEIGIESIYTSIYPGSKPIKVNTNIPSPQANHIILCIPQPNDTIWLECTNKNSPFNYLGSFTQNRLAFIINKDNSKLVNTPKLTLQESLEKNTIDIEINELGNANFTSKGIAYGKSFDELLLFDNDYTSAEKEKYIDKIGLLKGADINEFILNRVHRDSSYIFLELKGKIPHIKEDIGKKTILLPAKKINYKLNPIDERNAPISISYPTNKNDSITYHFAYNISQISGKNKYNIQSKFGSYKKDIVINNNKLIVSTSFQLKQGRYTKENYPDFYFFINQVNNIENKKIIITH